MDGQMTIFDFIPDPTKVYELDIKGICDDAYCPKCGYCFWDNETDAERCPKCGVKVSWKRWHEINDEERKCCNNCNRYRMTVDATTCEPKYMICHRPGTVYGDQITNPESYVCECWEEKGENDKAESEDKGCEDRAYRC